MEENNLNRNLTCVLFPGVVKNDEKALKCLGGIKQISHVYSECSTKRLGLNFQPDNPYIKQVFAEPKSVSGLLIKVKVKKTRVGNEVKRQVTSTTIVGTVKRMYIFETMSDYQYLPIEKEGAGPHQCLLDKILPSGVDDISFLNEPAPLFLPPPHFTRFDKTQYSYTARRHTGGGDARDDSGSEDEMHLAARMTRSLPTSQYNFNLTDEFPTEPHDYYLEMKEERLRINPYAVQEFETVKKLFDERPVWSVNLIRYHTKYTYTTLKLILPVYSFNMRTGPWRSMWVRIGYDPRKDPSARFYQSLDFRMRQTAGARSLVKSREKVRQCKRADRLRLATRRRGDHPGDDDDVCESMGYFRAGLVPAQRQVFYMYCDIQLPEVQALVSLEPPPGTLCHHKRGWLAPGVADACRDLLTKQVMKTLLASRGDVKLEESKSDEESISEDDNTGNSTATDLEEPSTSTSTLDPQPSTSVT